jgi:hypothetical protein
MTPQKWVAPRLTETDESFLRIDLILRCSEGFAMVFVCQIDRQEFEGIVQVGEPGDLDSAQRQIA